MNQEDIFRLLLIVLLLANRQLASDAHSDDGDETDEFSYTMINDLLLLVMATQLFDGTDSFAQKNTTFR